MGATLVLCKPDAVERGLVGEIVSRFERKGLRIAAARLLRIDEELAARHYAEHTDKPFYPELRDFIGRSPTLALVLEGPEGTYAIVRSLMGPTNPADAPPGTIRGDFGLEVTENLVHGSDSEAAAAREIALFFGDLGT
ncbi:MAG: nucleoside-diphosphate kinase [bacterium]|nr:nucleoside-diphosphate kinase [bacterium]MXZ30587.1 nucleoside-diphosphate kinase [Acidimicrobiia bacterium]MDE0668242.1 nucleoside-diphosphate kinase [bacterium]MYB24624.1 nucleoside-diphosphate kinase [Acidimicrobiia bacterium]MYE67875.1 nucleoside-diphosphate kinase [Acidimicrobiia bacterium]